jgi:hypothetical protein
MLDQVRDFLEGAAVQHYQAALAGHFGIDACLERGLANQVVQFDQGFSNEGHPAVLGGEFFQNVGIKDKGAVHFVAIFEGVEQCSVVCHP